MNKKQSILLDHVGDDGEFLYPIDHYLGDTSEEWQATPGFTPSGNFKLSDDDVDYLQNYHVVHKFSRFERIYTLTLVIGVILFCLVAYYASYQ